MPGESGPFAGVRWSVEGGISGSTLQAIDFKSVGQKKSHAKTQRRKDKRETGNTRKKAQKAQKKLNRKTAECGSHRPGKVSIDP